ncbi:MAG: GntR family transcriptional regulator [Clostridiales Family XIII bacterium]|jgi:DNA-binding GntR family transcriptional regulator|nr:GntR family transcriptional regulator [Clostridiales Family XIII bacterium]
MDVQTSLSTDLAEKIRIEILSERLRPGAKITELSLSRMFGVSRTPVREALKNLDTEGLIDMIPNRGAFVVGLSMDDLKDLYALRTSAEVQAVRWAVERRTADEMEGIEESLDFMIFYTERGDTKRMRSINAGFHRKIALASHCRIVIDDLFRMQEYIRYSIRIKPYRADELADILREHQAIFTAFKASDPEAGAAAMHTHIQNSLTRANL